MKKEKKREKKPTILLFLLVVIFTTLVIGGGVLWYQGQSLKKLKRELEIAGRATPFPSLPTPTPDLYAGWLTYKNELYHYQFRYPPEAEIREIEMEAFGLSPEETEAGVTFEEKYQKYTGKICLTISYKLGYVQISAPPNKGFAHVLCGRTGRAYEGVERSEELTIDGKRYTAKGFEEKGPGETLNFHNETLVVVLDEGTRIEYGSIPDESATFADYQKMRGEIIKIVESYRKI